MLLKRGFNKLFFLVQNYFHFPIAKQERGIDPEVKLEPIHSIEQFERVGAAPVEPANSPEAVSSAVT